MSIVKSALIAYLNSDLSKDLRDEVIHELERLDENNQQFWADFLAHDEELAYLYSDTLDLQGGNDEIPEF